MGPAREPALSRPGGHTPATPIGHDTPVPPRPQEPLGFLARSASIIPALRFPNSMGPRYGGGPTGTSGLRYFPSHRVAAPDAFIQAMSSLPSALKSPDAGV